MHLLQKSLSCCLPVGEVIVHCKSKSDGVDSSPHQLMQKPPMLFNVSICDSDFNGSFTAMFELSEDMQMRRKSDPGIININVTIVAHEDSELYLLSLLPDSSKLQIKASRDEVKVETVSIHVANFLLRCGDENGTFWNDHNSNLFAAKFF